MIAIIDYRAGNLTSVKLAFDSLNVDSRITDSPADILSAERVVFPGVGAAGASMANLRKLKLVDTIRQVVANGTPFLGICVGTQVALEHSDEDGGVDCIGLIPGAVRRFAPANPFDKVPQMGWNRVRQLRPHPLFEGIVDESEFYFVHSYYPAPADPAWVIGETGYGGIAFASMLAGKNLVATQFHPEKSGRVGLRLLQNFVTWDGRDPAC